MKPVFSALAVCGLCLGIVLPGSAEVIELNRQVFLAGDKPAVGATASVYVFDGSTTQLKQTQKVTVGEDGWLRVKVDIPPSPSETVLDDHMGRRAIYNRHYMLVDAAGASTAPDAPVAIVPIHSYSHKERGWANPLRLEKGATINGKVFHEGKPVAGAQVSMVWMRGILINSLDKSVQNPALQAQSGADGSFAIRPVILDHAGHPHDAQFPLCSLLAEKKVGTETLYGSMAEVSPVPPTTAPNPIYNPSLSLAGTWKLRGTVVNEATGKPVAGATVEVATRSMWPLSPVKTDATGAWEATGIPPNREVFAVATHPNTSVGVVRAVSEGNPADAASGKSRTIGGLTITVKPMARLSGRVEEEGTGKLPPPMFPNREVPEVMVRASWGEQFGNSKVGGQLVRGPIAADGTFSMMVPVGEVSPGLNVPGYIFAERPTVQLTSAGQKDLILKIKKKPAFYVRLESPEPEGLKDLSIVTIREDGTEVSTGSLQNNSWYSNARQWGDTLKIRVRKGYGRDIKGIKDVTLTADPAQWPQIITVP